MPAVHLIIYRAVDGTAPLVEWMEYLRMRVPGAYAKSIAKLRLLSERGHELRRPAADFLRDGIYELRMRQRNVNYRILYFFHGKDTAVLSHGLTKTARVPASAIDRAIVARTNFLAMPDLRTYAPWRS